MIYITGDKHGDYSQIEEFCMREQTTKDDLLIVLGDHGVNYSGGKRDQMLKDSLSKLPIIFMLVRGNHDRRPEEPPLWSEYIKTPSYSGVFVQDASCGNVLYAKDGESYKLGNHTALVLGGAYSIDKHFRLAQRALGNTQFKWFPDEQLTRTEMRLFESLFNKEYTYILTHTCPLRYRPLSNVVPMNRKYAPDESMEKWFDKLEKKIAYERWYCGHWHIDKEVDKVRFMYNDIARLV